MTNITEHLDLKDTFSNHCFEMNYNFLVLNTLEILHILQKAPKLNNLEALET